MTERATPSLVSAGAGPAAEAVVNLARRLADSGADGQTALDQAARTLGLPAAEYRAARSLALQSGLIAETAVNAPGSYESLHAETDDGDTESDGGWDAVGIDVFLKAHHHRLLTAEEEVELAKRRQRGLLAAKALDEHPGMAWEPRREFLRQMRDGRRAADDLVTHNLRLVAKLAHRLKRRGGPALEFEDLFQEGLIGLARAVDKFNPDRGFKLSTYATWWVRQSMERAIADKVRAIRLPVHMWEQVNALARAERDLMAEEIDVTDHSLADRMGVPEGRVRELRRISRPMASLDRQLAGGGSLKDLQADPFQTDPAEMLDALGLAQAIHEALDQLNDRERAVIELRFGLVDGTARTLEQVGQEFGVTRERIRQIEAKVLGRLRDPERFSALAGFRPVGRSTTGQEVDRSQSGPALKSRTVEERTTSSTGRNPVVDRVERASGIRLGGWT